MRLVDQLRSVRHTFDSNRARSALTLLGIMIGAGSIVLLAGLLKGGQEMLLYSEQAASETDIVRVSPDDAPVKQRERRIVAEQDSAVIIGHHHRVRDRADQPFELAPFAPAERRGKANPGPPHERHDLIEGG